MALICSTASATLPSRELSVPGADAAAPLGSLGTGTEDRLGYNLMAGITCGSSADELGRFPLYNNLLNIDHMSNTIIKYT